MNEKLNEHNITFTVVPENYDYTDGEIVYRIFLDFENSRQLLIERVLPELSPNSALVEMFVLRKITDKCVFTIESITKKRVIVEKFFISNREITTVLPGYFTTPYGLIRVIVKPVISSNPAMQRLHKLFSK